LALQRSTLSDIERAQMAAQAGGVPASEVAESSLLRQKGLGPSYGVVPLERQTSVDVKDDTCDDLCPSSEEHYPFLDLTRLGCVFMVAVDHGAPAFGYWNVFFAQGWVLQYLFLVCGVCFGMSKKPLLEYELRLGVYAVIGVCVNWSAWLLMGLDWRSNFFNVVFHIWFVVGLMVYAVLLVPVRAFLVSTRAMCDQRAAAGENPEEADLPQDEEERGGDVSVPARAEQRDALLHALVVIGGGVLGILILFKEVMQPLLKILAPVVLQFVSLLGTGTSFWGLPQNSQESLVFLEQVCSYSMVTTTNLYLMFTCPRVFKRRQLTAWAVLINTYGHRMLWYRSSDERPWHGFDLMTIALTTYFLGILHRRTLGKYIARYWFVPIALCGLLWPAGTYGRLDETPPHDISLRIRSTMMEAIFIVVWLCAGDRIVHKEIFTEDKMVFMNDWALIVFLVHKAVHMMLPSPTNWLVILGIGPVCYIRRHMP